MIINGACSLEALAAAEMKSSDFLSVVAKVTVIILEFFQLFAFISVLLFFNLCCEMCVAPSQLVLEIENLKTSQLKKVRNY